MSDWESDIDDDANQGLDLEGARHREDSLNKSAMRFDYGEVEDLKFEEFHCNICDTTFPSFIEAMDDQHSIVCNKENGPRPDQPTYLPPHHRLYQEPLEPLQRTKSANWVMSENAMKFPKIRATQPTKKNQKLAKTKTSTRPVYHCSRCDVNISDVTHPCVREYHEAGKCVETPRGFMNLLDEDLDLSVDDATGKWKCPVCADQFNGQDWQRILEHANVTKFGSSMAGEKPPLEFHEIMFYKMDSRLWGDALGKKVYDNAYWLKQASFTNDLLLSKFGDKSNWPFVSSSAKEKCFFWMTIHMIVTGASPAEYFAPDSDFEFEFELV